MRTAKRLVYWLAGFMIVIPAIIFFLNRAVDAVDNGIIHYEEFQELYNTCTKINTDLCNMQQVPDTDKMFSQFSKAQRINTLKTNLNRWIEDYNAKSKMWNRALWKSKNAIAIAAIAAIFGWRRQCGVALILRHYLHGVG